MTLCAECRQPTKNIGGTEVCLPCWVRTSCEEQGVPVKVTDPLVLGKIAVLMGWTPNK